MRTLTLALAGALMLTSVLAKSDGTDCAADPYADPAADRCNPLRYVPNKAVNIVAAVLYFVVALLLTLRTIRHKGYYMLCLTIAAWCEGLGLALRLGLRENLHSKGWYIVMYLFVVLSPCAFLAGDYILLGRIVDHLDAARYLFIKPSKVSWTFVISDIITFLIQAAGGGLSTSDDTTQALTGSRIFLAGIAAQMASFILFSTLWAVFIYRVYRHDTALRAKPGWQPLYWALGFTCVCFLIRSVYRTVELSQGYVGYLATHERYFLGLDTLPLLLGISVYTWFWPAKYLVPETRVPRDASATGADAATPVDAEVGQTGASVGSAESEPKPLD
ncbi:hypothetical protein Q5752_006237 [Cryptotrichosporon argae]